MKYKIEYLKDKFRKFQLENKKLGGELSESNRKYEDRENEFIRNLLEVLDAFEMLDENIKQKEASLDKPALMLFKNVKSIQGKILRFLKANNVVPIALNGSKATHTHCRIIETRHDPRRENEAIISIIKNGYINTEKNKVL